MVIRSRRSARRLVAAALLTTAGLVATACGGNDPSDTTSAATTAEPDGGSDTTAAEGSDTTAAPSTAPVFTNAPTTTAEAAPEPQPGGTLTVGIEGESTGYAPNLDVWPNAGHNVGKATFDTLAVYDASGKVVPYLAESITGNDDATVWTVTLRPGITFHDGSALDAEAVRLNFQSILDSAQFKDQLSLLASMNVVDELTIELTMSSPWGTCPNTHLRKLILAIDTEFASNTSWRFVRADYAFPVPTNPWFEVFPEVYNVNDLAGNILNADFVAMKIGDVNSSAATSSASLEPRTIEGVFALETADQN